jgi:hypothetical protein
MAPIPPMFHGNINAVESPFDDFDNGYLCFGWIPRRRFYEEKETLE